MDLHQRIANRQSGILLFGVTPPRQTATAEKVQEIAERTLERLHALDLDGLILYDIDDESDRNTEARPFPYLPTMDPADFYTSHLASWSKPVIIYRCVGKYPRTTLQSWLREQDTNTVLTVFVGASSRHKDVHTGLPQAVSTWHEERPELMLGGVTIPERHTSQDDEHLRLINKQTKGCSFFVTQVVYDVNAAKNLVSDYYYTSQERGSEPVPIIFTLSVCGSERTLEFLQWLGVHVPHWMQNQLRNVDDTLAESYDHCVATARELSTFCDRLGLPYGFNVESVSIRKDEIEASVALAEHLRGQLR